MGKGMRAGKKPKTGGGGAGNMQKQHAADAGDAASDGSGAG